MHSKLSADDKHDGNDDRCSLDLIAQKGESGIAKFDGMDDDRNGRGAIEPAVDELVRDDEKVSD